MVTVDPAHIKFLRKPPPRAGWADITKQLMEKGSPKALTPFYLPPYAAPWLFVPAYLETSFAACSLPRCCTHPGHAHCTPQQQPLSATGADALCGWIGGNTGGALYDV